MKRLPLARTDLANLVEYLIDTDVVSEDYRELKVSYDPGLDKYNQKSARGFCYTDPKNWDIKCTKSIEVISPATRIGVLLHEIGHIHQNAFYGQGKNDFEIGVEKWILTAVPESDYRYDNEVYHDPDTQKLRKAVNVQRVSREFVRRIQNAQEKQ